MRRLSILFTFALLTSCVTDNVDYIGGEIIKPSADSGIHVFGAVEEFDVKNVSTRADGDVADSYISEMTMFVFDKYGNIIQGYSDRTVTEVDDKGNPTKATFAEKDKCTSAINIQKPNPTFLIDTKGGIIASLDDASPRIVYYDNLTSTDDNLSECKIYIVANAYHELEGKLSNITTLAQLETVQLSIDNTLAMPMKDKDQNLYRGFPMIGTHANQTFDLSKAGNNSGAVAKIPLKKLYSKVRFTMQVNADQVVEGQTPKFKIDSVQVFNVPSRAHLGRKITDTKPDYSDSPDYIVEMVGNNSYTPSDYYHFTEKAFTIKNFKRDRINHTTSKVLPEGSEYLIEFGFYMPEHKVTPNYNSTNYPDYPENIPDGLKQYYKPELVGAVRNEDGTTTNSNYATYVRIHGEYTDHNGQIKKVRYDIYLGQNNTDDFTVKRNQLLNNKLVVRGLTNYYDAYGENQENISIDHRVDVDYQGFNLSMERTAILDAHFEVRPLDIELSPRSTMKITIPEAYRDWIAMESDEWVRQDANYNPNVYVSKDERKAVRKYFTTDLVKELNNLGTFTDGNGGEITISHNGQGSKIFRVWFYIDENPNVYDKLWKEGDPKVSYTGAVNDVVTVGTGDSAYTINKTTYRICPVQFKYFGTDNDNTGGGAATVTKDATINFQQWNLWRVWSANKTRYYDIEHEEEYLNNYASDQQYGSTQNGMSWGLDGVQLSNRIQAIKIEESTDFINFINGIGKYLGWDLNGMYTKVIQGMKNAKYYDFYLTRDGWILADGEKAEDYKRDYSGFIFNEEIATILKKNYATQQVAHTEDQGYLAQIEKLNLTQSPSSAFAYCYHKNKRNNDGEVVELKWFLPAIDEIEDIALGAYDEFDRVFQNKKYWSCQPAYDKNRLSMDVMVSRWNPGDVLADYYSDDLDRARATSVHTTNGVNYQNIDSGVPGYAGTQGGTVDWTTPSFGNYISNTLDFSDYPGNLPRTESCRIRAVYRSGTK